jgi:predicted RNA binding protein YcfA (HicA-like mRNA interferase family)
MRDYTEQPQLEVQPTEPELSPEDRAFVELIKEASALEGPDRHEMERLIDDAVGDNDDVLRLRSIAAEELVEERRQESYLEDFKASISNEVLAALENKSGKSGNGHLPSLPAQRVARALERAGLVRQNATGGGSHVMFRDSETGEILTCFGGNKTIRPGLLKKIIDQAGLTPETFKSYI